MHWIPLLFALWIGWPAAAGDQAFIEEFKKYFKEFAREYGRAGKDDKARRNAVVSMREAVMTLKDQDDPAVVEALAPAIKIDEPELRVAVIDVLASFKQRAAIDALLAAIAVEKADPPRALYLEAIERGKYGGTAAALSTLLAAKSWELRRGAALALAASGDPTVPDLIAPLTADPEAAVRGAAIDGLARVRSPLVVDPAIRALGEEVWQVRASAIAALAKVRDKRSIAPLIARLEVEEGRLKPEIGAALDGIVGRNFGERLELWKQFWERNGERFQIPTEAQLEELRKAQAEANAAYGKVAPAAVYHGIDTPSRSMVFVIDVSGSMENLVIEKERFESGGYPSMVRCDIVKTELARTIERLEPNVFFNVVSFATDVKFWKAKLQAANIVSKASATDFVRKLEPIGGNSKDELARAGLVAAANLDGGQTNTYAALCAALGIDAKRGKEDDYAVPVDTVFFLSDGRPSTGEWVNPDDILREIKRANELRKVVIHTIAIGDFNKDFMRRLAEENGGVFVDLGR